MANTADCFLQILPCSEPALDRVPAADTHTKENSGNTSIAGDFASVFLNYRRRSSSSWGLSESHHLKAVSDNQSRRLKRLSSQQPQACPKVVAKSLADRLISLRKRIRFADNYLHACTDGRSCPSKLLRNFGRPPVFSNEKL